ncbi:MULTISPECIES: hypothetical protein [unclassified Oceanispirochaeta]|nr:MULTISPECIES: hypothetical protein [unclassified Oceanispirochaeta]
MNKGLEITQKRISLFISIVGFLVVILNMTTFTIIRKMSIQVALL